MRDGKLGVARRALPADAKIVDNALGALLQGPSEAETAAGLTTAVPGLTRVRSTALMGDVLVVDLSGSFSTLGPPGSSELRLAQIVYTVSVFPVRVLFHIDGQPARAVGGYILPDRPVTRDDFAAWAPPVLVESVGPEDVLTNGTEISGSTAVADTGVGMRISDAAGQVLFEGITRSTRDDGLRHPFRAAAPFLLSQPGPGTLTVWELEPVARHDTSGVDHPRPPRLTAWHPGPTRRSRTLTSRCRPPRRGHSLRRHRSRRPHRRLRHQLLLPLTRAAATAARRAARRTPSPRSVQAGRHGGPCCWPSPWRWPSRTHRSSCSACPTSTASSTPPWSRPRG